MSTELVHLSNGRVEVRHGGGQLFLYVYEPAAPQRESPKPYFHPLRTLAGDVVTAARPHDHPWHAGLAMTSAHLSGQNFWGGPTFTRDRGYVQLDNNGCIRHVEWLRMDCEDGLPVLVERLQWLTSGGEVWIEETRRLAVRELNPDRGYWSLDLGFRLENASGGPLAFGSPTTEGRPMAGYGGLFWRGSSPFVGGRVAAADHPEGGGAMGSAARWLAIVGRRNHAGRESTILFCDDPANPRFPNKWFVRNEPYACASCSFMFDEEYTLGEGEALGLRYRVLLVDGAWTADGIERCLADPRDS